MLYIAPRQVYVLSPFSYSQDELLSVASYSTSKKGKEKLTIREAKRIPCGLIQILYKK